MIKSFLKYRYNVEVMVYILKNMTHRVEVCIVPILTPEGKIAKENMKGILGPTVGWEVVGMPVGRALGAPVGAAVSSQKRK